VEERFEAAVGVIQGLPKDGSFQPSNEMKLKFYAFYKQARDGPCVGARPSFWDVVARAKHDAWAHLGQMTSNQAKIGYIDALKQIIETMNFNADVEKFIEALGPFYEYVSEDRLLSGNPHLVEAARSSQAVLKELHRQDQEDIPGLPHLQGEDADMESMLGHFMEPEGPDSNENWEEHGDLLKEIRWTKENLQHTMELLKDCVNDNQVEQKNTLASEDKMREVVEEEVRELRPSGASLSHVEIERMLDNMDGYLPPSSSITSSSLVSSPPLYSCNEDSDQEEVFEDTLEGGEGGEEEGENTEEEVEDEVLHVEVEVVDSHPCSLDSGMWDCSPPAARPPPAPRIHARRAHPCQEEEDQILMISSNQQVCCTSPMETVVERMAGDMDHLKARVASLETILSLRGQVEVHTAGWWPFTILTPRTVLWMVTWPLVAHGAILLARAAVARSRR